MFQIAHYRIVGDVGEVLPLIIKTLRERALGEAQPDQRTIDQREAE
jgi:hypothetical protein